MRFKQPIGQLPNVIAYVKNMELVDPSKDRKATRDLSPFFREILPSADREGRRGML
jgi:hypothetical protein